MSDAMSDSYKQRDLWETAKVLVKMYYGKTEMSENISKEWIEKWLSKYGRTPEETAKELGVEL